MNLVLLVAAKAAITVAIISCAIMMVGVTASVVVDMKVRLSQKMSCLNNQE